MNKIIRFDLLNLLKVHGTKDIVHIVRELPKHTGSSYLLNYGKLKKESLKLKCPEVHLLNYLVLASFRDYFKYKSSGDNTLPLELALLTKQEIIENPYIERRNNKIIFLLE